MGRDIVTNGDFTADVCDSVSTVGAAVWGGACGALLYYMGSTSCNKISGDHFRRRYQTVPWDTFAATRPSSQLLWIDLLLLAFNATPIVCTSIPHLSSRWNCREKTAGSRRTCLLWCQTDIIELCVTIVLTNASLAKMDK